MNLFLEKVLGLIPRYIGFLDRDNSSESYGCFDRYYWLYRQKDFPNVRFQECIYLFALVYSYDFPGNKYYNNNNLLEWAKAGIKYLFNCVNKRDGSFDELYPNERSFCGTSFTTYLITEAALLLKIDIPNNAQNTGHWLLRNNNTELINQMTASIMALYNLHLITNNSIYLDGAKEKLEKILDLQNIKGYYPEYGGYDLGYLSIQLSCLGKYYKKTNDPVIYKSALKAVKFAEQEIDENGLFDYHDSSRQTQFLYPYGFLIFNSRVINRIINGLKQDIIINPFWMDDRYSIGMAIDYMETYLEIRNADGND